MSDPSHLRFLERFSALFNQPNVDIADEVMVPQFKGHAPMAPELDREGWKAYVRPFYDAFPDLHMDVHDVVSSDDKLVIRVTFRGTHQGSFQGAPATGRPIAITALALFQMENGLAVEEWAEMDVVGLLQQIGVMPAVGGG
jgi:steroid delta-isomerase-like uncharacterized protein